MRHQNIRRKLYQYVVEVVGVRIVKGDYRPGETLPNEEALCSEFDVSRGVLREATKVLTEKGLIRSRPKTGTRVQPRSAWNLFDADLLVWTLRAGNKIAFLQSVTEVRRIIESEAARLAATRAGELEVAALQRACSELADFLADEGAFDYETYLELDMQFHSGVLEASHNELLAQIGRTMRRAVQTARQADSRSIAILRESLPHHLAMVEAIARRDPERAHAAARDMFDQVWRHIPRQGAAGA
jgi:DNA-binding FadR family transcriptional regulator